MYLNFRQGLISGRNFIMEGSSAWGIRITDERLRLTLANGTQDILIDIDDDRSGVFGPIDKNKDQFLYMELDRRGNYVFGSMDNDYIVSDSEPQDPDDGQWWYNTREDILYKKIPNRGFIRIIGVILADIVSGVVNERSAGVSQVGIIGSNNQFRASELLRDVDGHSIILSDFTYLTKITNLLIDGVTPLGSIEASNVYGIADEDIPANSVVRLIDNGDDLPKIELVEYDDVGDSVVGFVNKATFYGETAKISLHGIFINSSWDLLNGARTGDFIYAGLDGDRGLIINYDPHAVNPLIPRQPPIGRIINKTTILFSTSNNQIIDTEEERPEPVTVATVDKAGIVKISKPSADPNDPVVVETNDPRMYDARMPLHHTHSMDEIDFDFDDLDIDFEQGGGTGGDPSNPSNLEEWIEYLFMNKINYEDPRLFDARVPLPHLHPAREVEVEAFEDFQGNVHPDNDAQSWIETLFNEKIGRSGGVVDGTLTILKDPEYGTDAVNKAFVDKMIGSAHRTAKIHEIFEYIGAGATESAIIDLSEYGVELDGSGIRGILFYRNVITSSTNPYEITISDPVRGRQYTSTVPGEDRDPITVEFSDGVELSITNLGSSEIETLAVEISILILEGIESTQVGLGEDDSILLSSDTSILDVTLRSLVKTIEVGKGETNTESLRFNALGLNSTRIIEVDLSFYEKEYELLDPSNFLSVDGNETKVTRVSGLDVSRLSSLYDSMCIACTLYGGDRCATTEHYEACVAANEVLNDSSATQKDVDNAWYSLNQVAIMFTTNGSGRIILTRTRWGEDTPDIPIWIKYRPLGSTDRLVQLVYWPSGMGVYVPLFSESMEVYIHGNSGDGFEDREYITGIGGNLSEGGPSSILREVVNWNNRWGDGYNLNHNNRPFEVPDYTPFYYGPDYDPHWSKVGALVNISEGGFGRAYSDNHFIVSESWEWDNGPWIDENLSGIEGAMIGGRGSMNDSDRAHRIITTSKIENFYKEEDFSIEFIYSLRNDGVANLPDWGLISHGEVGFDLNEGKWGLYFERSIPPLLTFRMGEVSVTTGDINENLLHHMSHDTIKIDVTRKDGILRIFANGIKVLEEENLFRGVGSDVREEDHLIMGNGRGHVLFHDFRMTRGVARYVEDYEYEFSLSSHPMRNSTDYNWGSRNVPSFANCIAFNSQAVSIWDTGTAVGFSGTFQGCENFNAPIGTWDVSRGVFFNNMFQGSGFNRDISSWEIGRLLYRKLGDQFDWILDLENLFKDSQFNMPVNDWGIQTTSSNSWGIFYIHDGIFENCPYNHPLDKWFTEVKDSPSRLTTERMFYNNVQFNQDLGGWILNTLREVRYMFYGCENLTNSNIGKWRTDVMSTSQMNVDYMLSKSAVNENLLHWNASRIIIGSDFPGFRRGSGDDTLDAPKYNKSRPRFGSYPVPEYIASTLDEDAYFTYIDYGKLDNNSSGSLRRISTEERQILSNEGTPSYALVRAYGSASSPKIISPIRRGNYYDWEWREGVNEWVYEVILKRGIATGTSGIVGIKSLAAGRETTSGTSPVVFDRVIEEPNNPKQNSYWPHRINKASPAVQLSEFRDCFNTGGSYSDWTGD